MIPHKLNISLTLAVRTLSGPTDGFDLDAQAFTVSAVGATDTLQWILSDHLNSASVTANADGTWNSTIQYTAFGEVRASKGLTATKYRYTGQLAQDSLGLDYYVARWYDPVTGHFTSPDSIIPDPGKTNAFNRYAYVLNNPLRNIDPTGHSAAGECDDGGDCEETEEEKSRSRRNAELLVIQNDEENGCKESNCDRGVEILAFAVVGVVGSAVAMTLVTDLVAVATATNITTAATTAETTNVTCSQIDCGGKFNEAAKIVNNEFAESTKTINTIEQHLQQFGEDPPNLAMINRLKEGLSTTWDKNFVQHELIESQHMASGLAYEDAHLLSLGQQGIQYGPGYEAYLYHPEVIDAFPTYFNSAAITISSILRNTLQ